VLAQDFADLMTEIAADQAQRGVAVDEDAGRVLAYDELRVARTERSHES
jgi:hypothetical protein